MLGVDPFGIHPNIYYRTENKGFSQIAKRRHLVSLIQNVDVINMAGEEGFERREVPPPPNAH